MCTNASTPEVRDGHLDIYTHKYIYGVFQQPEGGWGVGGKGDSYLGRLPTLWVHVGEAYTWHQAQLCTRCTRCVYM